MSKDAANLYKGYCEDDLLEAIQVWYWEKHGIHVHRAEIVRRAVRDLARILGVVA